MCYKPAGPSAPRLTLKEGILCRKLVCVCPSRCAGRARRPLLPGALTAYYHASRSSDPYLLLKLAMFHLSLRHVFFFFFPRMIVKGIFRHPYCSYWIVNLSWWIRLIKMAFEEKPPFVPPKLEYFLSLFIEIPLSAVTLTCCLHISHTAQDAFIRTIGGLNLSHCLNFCLSSKGMG